MGGTLAVVDAALAAGVRDRGLAPACECAGAMAAREGDASVVAALAGRANSL